MQTQDDGSVMNQSERESILLLMSIFGICKGGQLVLNLVGNECTHPRKGSLQT